MQPLEHLFRKRKDHESDPEFRVMGKRTPNPKSHEDGGCRAGWAKESEHQPKLPEGEYHCKCTNYEAEPSSIGDDKLDNR